MAPQLEQSLNKIINLGKVRDLLAEWTKVRQAVTAEKVSGWYTVVRDDQGGEALYLGGVYKQNPELALKAALKISAARTLLEDDPLPSLKAEGF